MPDLGELMAHDMDFNKGVVAEGGELVPRWVARNESGETFVLATPWSDDSEKEQTLAMLRVFFAAHDIVSYTFSAEAWSVKLTAPEGRAPSLQDATDAMGGLTPSQHPDRIEVINVVGADKHGSMMVTSEIIRDGDKISFGPIQGMGENGRVEGRMTNLLFDTPMPEETKRAMRKVFAAMNALKPD